MRDFIDKTATSLGTPINRAVMMAVQGFENATASYGNGQRIIQFGSGERLTTIATGEYVKNTLVGEKIITKTTRIIGGNIEEAIS